MALVFSLKAGRSQTSGDFTPDNGIHLPADTGRAVILIHGLTGTPNEMRFLAGFFQKKGYAVICPRLAKHGEPLTVLKNARWEEFYTTVRDTFTKARAQYETVYTSGLSMGALLALLLAEEFGNKVAAVSGLSPTLFYDGWNVPWYTCFLPLAYATPLKHFFYFKEVPPYGIKNENVRRFVHNYYDKASIDDIKGAAQWGYPYFPLTMLCELKRLVKYCIPRFKNITSPVQLIQAQNDDLTSVKNSQFIHDRVGSRQKEIVLLHDSYHVITADQERGKVAEAMDRFFNAAVPQKVGPHV